jgi:hypothetical protein
MTMRSIIMAAVVIGAALPSAGHAQTYPWCAQYGRMGGGGRNCGFSTYEQCLATVSGIGGFCERNTFYTAPERVVRRPKRAVRHD